MIEHYDELLAYARKRLANDAEDLVQSVYLEIIEKQHSPDRALLFHALKCRLSKHKRHVASLQMTTFPPDVAEPEPPPCAEIQIQSLTVTLKSSDKDFIMAAYAKGYQKAAEEFGHSYPAAKKRGQRILEKLRKLLLVLI